MISTRGRYALRVMIDLAEHQCDSYVPIKAVAERQDISLKYLERIMPILIRGNMVEGVPGKGGGYRLNRNPDEYIVGSILRLTERELAPVACLANDAMPCGRAVDCKTLPMWEKYNEMTNQFFDGITISELLEGKY